MRRHPEMDDQREWVLETLAEPDMIQQGDFGELLAVRFYPETPLTRKFLVMAYRVGLTLIGLRARLLKGLAGSH